MKAVTLADYGGSEVLLHRDLPVPSPAHGEVLVRVACAGINFMDVLARQGRYANSKTYRFVPPATLGMEGSGEVVAVGAGVRRLRIGDRVAWCLAWGSYAEFACVPEALAARLPPGLGDELAAAAMFQGCTAHYLVHDVARLAAGESCLVHAAAGAIGQIVVQFAKARGATVIATASSAAKRAVALARGADHAIEYGDFARQVRELTGGAGVDVAFDAVGATTLRESFRAVRRRGLVVNYGAVSGPVIDLDPLELGEAGSIFLTRPRLADHMTDAETVQRRADAVFGAITQRRLHIDISGRYAMDDVAQAHARLEGRTQVGKPILRIAEPVP